MAAAPGGLNRAAASTASTGAEESTGRAKKAARARKEEGRRRTGKEEGKEGEKEKPSPEKAALIKEGDKICSKASPPATTKKLQALEKKNGGKKPSTKETNLKAAVPPLYTAIEEFEALTAPSGEEAELEAVISSLEAAAKGLEEKPESELTGPKSPFAEFQKVTGEYGMQVCRQL